MPPVVITSPAGNMAIKAGLGVKWLLLTMRNDGKALAFRHFFEILSKWLKQTVGMMDFSLQNAQIL